MAEDANGVVREAVTCAAFGRPAPVQRGKPKEKLAAERGPAPPKKLPRGRRSGSVEESVIAGFGRVNAVCRPTPGYLVGCGGKGHALEFAPKADVLKGLRDPERAVDVANPGMLLKALADHGASLAPARYEGEKASVDLLYFLALDPLICPK